MYAQSAEFAQEFMGGPDCPRHVSQNHSQTKGVARRFKSVLGLEAKGSVFEEGPRGKNMRHLGGVRRSESADPWFFSLVPLGAGRSPQL